MAMVSNLATQTRMRAQNSIFMDLHIFFADGIAWLLQFRSNSAE